jgi:FkbM family methyltransferase
MVIDLKQQDVFIKQMSILDTIGGGHMVDKKYLSPSPLILDVGGNNGDTAKIARRLIPDSKIILFEPNKSLAKECFDTITDLNITIVEKAVVGNKTGKTALFYDFADRQNGRSSITGIYTDYPEFKSYITTYDVNTITINEIYKEYKLDQIDYLKIDSEGAEEDTIVSIDNKILLKIKQISAELHHNINHMNIINKLSNLFNITYFYVNGMGGELYASRKDLM